MLYGRSMSSRNRLIVRYKQSVLPNARFSTDRWRSHAHSAMQAAMRTLNTSNRRIKQWCVAGQGQTEIHRHEDPRFHAVSILAEIYKQTVADYEQVSRALHTFLEWGFLDEPSSTSEKDHFHYKGIYFNPGCCYNEHIPNDVKRIHKCHGNTISGNHMLSRKHMWSERQSVYCLRTHILTRTEIVRNHQEEWIKSTWCHTSTLYQSLSRHHAERTMPRISQVLAVIPGMQTSSFL